ncbi:OLC1v1008905C1 [Oldenlandia corymbosa var. corymbosa]|uniref:OLC1v1008905C1 n=1 Tax=Oldenlandia corymbosa var. corymbosa TaxID=529605 RepID=A0AAV1DQU7_OLDCO|nr:OLC1v1008905C1 [Oldenlandia corymbosa var. corymbosa]
MMNCADLGGDGKGRNLGKSIRVQQEVELEQLVAEIEASSTRKSVPGDSQGREITPEAGLGSLTKGVAGHLSDGCLSGIVWDGSREEKLKPPAGKLTYNPPSQHNGMLVAKM